MRSVTLLILRREERGGRASVDSFLDSFRLQQRVQLLYFLQQTSTRGREERGERREHLERPMLVRVFNGGEEVLLVHLSAHTSQNAISSSKHLLLLRCLLRHLLWQRLPLEFGGRRR
jgi:hypothetical protein